MTEVKSRTVLWYLVFIGFAVNYMIRINLNITIVEMIAKKSVIAPTNEHEPPNGMNAGISRSHESSQPNNHNEQTDDHDEDHYDFENTSAPSGTNMSQPIKRIKRSHNVQSHQDQLLHHHQTRHLHKGGDDSKYSIEKHLLDWTNTSYESQGFHWNEYEQGLVLGSFFWAHWATQIPGGILATKYGTKLVFGLSNAIGCWMCFLIPLISYFDYRGLICFRVIQGLITGVAWPAMHVLTAKWIPPNERSKFVTAYLGSSVGIAAFYPLFGYVMHWFSWEWVYHICGILGTLWWFAWLYFVFDSPAEHPRIADSERRYIEKSLGASVHNSSKGPTPWKAILTSKPVWMNVIAQWGGIWGLFTLMAQAPTYFRVVHNWNIRATGLLSGMPHLMRMTFAYLFSMFADYLLKSEKMSRTNLRKLATAVCCIVNGLIVLALAYFGHDPMAAIIFLTLATTVHGAVSSGPLASIVDISPNYAGIVLGISGMIGVLPGFISPYIVGILTLGNQSFESWKHVFIICSGMLIISGILYVCFAESTLQPWNSPQTGNQIHEKELQLLNEQIIEKNLKNEERKDSIILSSES